MVEHVWKIRLNSTKAKPDLYPPTILSKETAVEENGLAKASMWGRRYSSSPRKYEGSNKPDGNLSHGKIDKQAKKVAKGLYDWRNGVSLIGG
jgi:hypothetical protein